MQTSPGKPAPTGVTATMQTSPNRISQMGGTQTTPPPSPRRPTSTGGTQTTPPHNSIQDQGTQGQPDCNHNREDLLTQNAVSNTNKGKKNKKKPTHEVAPLVWHVERWICGT